MRKNFIKKLARSIKLVTNSRKPRLHEPFLNQSEIIELKNCIKSNYVSTVGPQVKKFEKKLSKLTGAKYVVATNSGTSALHLALKALNVEKNSEVLIPSLNFVAGGNVIKYCSAIPHFIESNKIDLSVDPLKLKTYLKRM